MKRTLFKLTLGLLLAWSLVATIRLPVAAQQTPTVTTMQNAVTATGNGTPLYVTGPAANPANVIGAAGIQVIGTFSGTVTFESTTDGSHWVEVLATNLSDNTQATTTTAAGQFTILLGSAVQVRARVSAYASGSITVVGRLVPGLVARVTSSGGGGGSGDFVGPGSATDNAIVRFNGTSGKLGQNSVATIGDTGDMAGVANFTFTGVLTGGSGPTTITDSAGKILSAALNTVQPAQGGTGITALGTGVATFLGTPSSANLAAAVTGETGSGALVFGTSPDFTTGATIGGVAIPTISSTSTLTNKTINGASNTLTARIANDVSGLGTGVATALGVNIGSAGAPVLFNGAGGTPSSITLTNGTGLSLTTGVTGDLPFSSFVQAPSAGFVGATASGDYSHRTPTQVTAALDAMVGDSGSGGTKGLVPAPASGDAAAGKFLKADGTWAVAGGSGGLIVGTTTITGGSSTDALYNNGGVLGSRTVTGSGNAVLSTSPTITTPAITTSATITNNSLGTSTAAGIELTNTTAAAAGAQQYSPCLLLTSQGWKTNSTAASQSTNWCVQNQSVQGAANPTTNLMFANQVNGGGYANVWVMRSAPSVGFLGSDSATDVATISRSGDVASLTLQANLSNTRGVTLTPNNSTGVANFTSPINAGISVNLGVSTSGVQISGSAGMATNYLGQGINVGRTNVGTFTMDSGALFSDVAAQKWAWQGGTAYTSASTNVNGGSITITGGTGAQDAGKTGVGGGVYLIGGAKSPSGTDGDVYLGYNGTTTRGRVVLGATALLLTGTGSPESAVTAPVGSIFLRTDGGAGTTFYVKESGSGNTGWVGK